MKKRVLLLVAALTYTLTGFGQALPDSLAGKIDQLFNRWNSSNTPGAAVGIVRGDSLIFAKGYGMADLEHHVANTPESIFYMCSVSKQFTGYAVTLLTRQGKLHLDDNIRLYLPWMADFGRKITIRHLLNHTSGIRDDINLAAISGLPSDCMLNQEFALELLKKQRTLNFEPGVKFSYSNSNYILLAEIVRVVSGQSFPAYMDSAIFKPLGMSHSVFAGRSDQLIADRVPSYSRSGNMFSNNFQNVYTLGDGGLFTNVQDMALWVANFFGPKAGDIAAIEQFTQKGKLNSGKTISYACGINSDSSRGYKRFIHNGGLAGYRTIVVIYPELKTGFIVFGNAGDGQVYSKADQLAALLIPDKGKKKSPVRIARRDSLLANLKDPAAFAALTGDYIAANGYHLSFTVKENRLWMNNQTLLVNDGGITFSLLANPAIKYIFRRQQNTVSADLYSPVLDKPIHLEGHPAGQKFSDGQLTAYTGTYFCPELGCYYQIRLKDHRLYFSNSLNADHLITLIGDDDLLSADFVLEHVRINRNKNGHISGFTYNSGEMMNLSFDKL